MLVIVLGEFGLVYRGEIVHPLSTERVAVKTLKGICIMYGALCLRD